MKFGVFDHLDRGTVPITEHFENRLKLAEVYDRAGFHAYQETMGAGATGFRRLVSAFHVDSKYLNPDDQGNRRLSQIFIPHTSPVCRLPFRLIF